MSESQTLSLPDRILALFHAAVRTVAPDVPVSIVLERPRQAGHGEYASTLALQLAKSLQRPPRDIAQALISGLPASPLVEKVEIAGPGFINVFLTAAAKQSVVSEVLQAGSRWGTVSVGHGRRVQVEFVSSNPTGPLHVGHGRGAAFGASLANVLAKAGYDVQREYYVNDAGRQMDILAVSTWLRYLTGFGSKIPFPPNGYQGDYVAAMAGHLRQAVGHTLVHPDEAVLAGTPGIAPPLREGDKDADAQNEAHMDALIANAKTLLGDGYRTLHQLALHEQLADCREDLEAFGVVFDRWFSEQSLYDDGSVARAVERLAAAGHLYEQDGARWFRSSAFGDEKDRVVQRENGIFTYFASDIAYHVNKFERGFDVIVDVWGADHHGYIPRVRAALTALGYEARHLQVPLVQFVSLYRHGEKAQMSTRKGQFVTLRELRTEVGPDAARFFYVLRKSDQHLDFDLDLAKSESNDNPVYYVQYAHARIHSVLQKWGGNPALLASVPLDALESPQEFGLMQWLRAYPEVIESAARDHAPHLLAFYLKDLAAALHSYYNAVQFLVPEESLKLARLALIGAVATTLRDGLQLLGVRAPESM
ncbi:MAG: arginine--tRNA ligase [Betaproteobacteria bacterium]|nr:arginine--tRNA ligase [Betaproteobacteria bacterium]